MQKNPCWANIKILNRGSVALIFPLASDAYLPLRVSMVFVDFFVFQDLVFCSAWIFWHLLLLFFKHSIKIWFILITEFFGISKFCTWTKHLFCLTLIPAWMEWDGERVTVKWDQITSHITSLWGLSFLISTMGPITLWLLWNYWSHVQWGTLDGKVFGKTRKCCPYVRHCYYILTEGTTRGPTGK